METDYQYDSLGRVALTLGPAHTAVTANSATTSTVQVIRSATWTVYQDADHQVWTAEGYEVPLDGSEELMGPVSIVISDADGNVTDQIQAVYGDGTDSGTRLVNDFLAAKPTDTPAPFPQSTYVAWSHNIYQDGNLIATQVYNNITATGGTYTETDYGYENYGTVAQPLVLMGQQNRVQTADGTITRTIIDVAAT